MMDIRREADEAELPHPLAIFFGLLAAVRLVEWAGPLGGVLTSFPGRTLEVVGAVALSVLPLLLPAAVLLWRREAWFERRLLLVGAVLFALPSAVEVLAFLMPDTLPWEPWSPFSSVVSIARIAVGLAELATPLLLALGLEETRVRTRTTWPHGLLAAAMVVAVIWIGWLLKGRLEFLQAGNAYGCNLLGSPARCGLDPVGLLSVSPIFLAPLYEVALLALAWSSLSALRAGEPPNRAWALSFAGAALLAAGWLLGHGFSIVMQLDYQHSVDFLSTGLYSIGQYLLLGLGYGCLVASFLVRRRSEPSPQEAVPAPGRVIRVRGA